MFDLALLSTASGGGVMSGIVLAAIKNEDSYGYQIIKDSVSPTGTKASPFAL